MIFKFNGNEIPKLNQLGGKAKALIETTRAGFPVPDGIALSVKFFDPWLMQIKSSSHWKKVLEDTTKENCDLVVNAAKNMTSLRVKENLIFVFPCAYSSYTNST